VDRARSGEEIVLADAGKPVVKLGPAADGTRAEPPDADNPRLRMHGMFEGQIWMSDDFADPLTDEELKDWGL
jgi:antitoxin (DNA-binding transcriptional repressor) of toxin-antitoxin stability system